MIIHDYECQKCGLVQEKYLDSNNIPDTVKCDCGGSMKKIVALGLSLPVDARWINGVLEVVDKKSREPHCTEFVKHQSRQNYENWMKGENIRHLEDGEVCGIPKKTKKEELQEKQYIKKELMKDWRERNTIIVR